MKKSIILNHQKKEIEIAERFDSVKKKYGLFFTPEWIVEFMIKISNFKKGKVLEPACGLGQFLSKMAEQIIKKSKKKPDLDKMLLGIELIKDLSSEANNYINEYLSANNYKVDYGRIPILNTNYLLEVLPQQFDLIIGNPPYGIMGNSSHYPISVSPKDKKIYKEKFRTWKGKYNIYGAFIEKSINLLKDSGKLVFIVPATFMLLDEFSKLRHFLAEHGKTSIYYLGLNVFRTAHVSTAIIKFEKGKKGLRLYDFQNRKKIKVVDKKEYSGELMYFEDKMTKAIEKGALCLGKLCVINIAARSPEIKKCSFVHKKKGTSLLPILKGTNLKPHKILYNKPLSGYWIKRDKITHLRDYYDKVRIVVGHTKGGKIEAAIDYKKYPWVGDVYQLTIIKNSDLFLPKFSMKDIVEILNSKLMNKYVAILYKKITPHTTATQLKLLPIHKKEKWRNLEKRYG